MHLGEKSGAHCGPLRKIKPTVPAQQIAGRFLLRDPARQATATKRRHAHLPKTVQPLLRPRHAPNPDCAAPDSNTS